jgi:hypothetical protein
MFAEYVEVGLDFSADSDIKGEVKDITYNQLTILYYLFPFYILVMLTAIGLTTLSRNDLSGCKKLGIKELVGELLKKALKSFAWGLFFSLFGVGIVFFFMLDGTFYDLLPGLILLYVCISITTSWFWMFCFGFYFHVEKEKRPGEIFQS